MRRCRAVGDARHRRGAPAYDPLELPELGVLELLRPLPMCVQWCVPADPGVICCAEPGPAELDPADGDADDDGLDEADDVADACVVAEPAVPVDASATPVAPAPSPPAMTPVMMSRRTRPPVMEIIRLLP